MMARQLGGEGVTDRATGAAQEQVAQVRPYLTAPLCVVQFACHGRYASKSFISNETCSAKHNDFCPKVGSAPVRAPFPPADGSISPSASCG